MTPINGNSKFPYHNAGITIFTKLCKIRKCLIRACRICSSTETPALVTSAILKRAECRPTTTTLETTFPIDSIVHHAGAKMYKLIRARPLLSVFRQNGLAQQKRSLSIHEYLSADLLRKVWFYIKEIFNSILTYIVWHWCP